MRISDFRYLLSRKKETDKSFVTKFTEPSAYPSALLGIMSVGFISTDRKGLIRCANDRAVIELGIEYRNITGKNINEFIVVVYNKQNIVEELFSRLKEGEKVIDLPPNTYVQNKTTGKKFFIKGQFIGQFINGLLSEVTFVFRNIEGELEQEYIMNMALKRTKIFPWFYDLEQNKMIVDKRWFTHLGIPTQNGTLSAEEFAALVHPEEREGLINALIGQLSGKLNTDTFTYRLRRSDGNWEWFEEQSVYLGGMKDTPYRIVGVCQSIQDHKNIENNLIKARDMAEESNRLKSAFLANMSHEIRTPLNAIVGFSNLLTNEEAQPDEAEAKEYARLINTNSEQLLSLISDILDLSKIESNTMEFRHSEQSLHKLLTDIYQSQVINMPTGVELVVQLPEKDICFHTDPMRIKQVINNLINNAIKFTSHGSITFGYRLIENDGQIEFFVRDTGIGISADQQANIFKRFYKADTFVQGAGLGLSICKTIVEHFGGSISVSSRPGEGTCFTILLPVKENQEKG